MFCFNWIESRVRHTAVVKCFGETYKQYFHKECADMPFKYFLLAPGAQSWKNFADSKGVHLKEVKYLSRDAGMLAESLRGYRNITLYAHRNWRYGLNSSYVVELQKVLQELLDLDVIGELIYYEDQHL